jgi:hypothetical protein
MIITIVDEELLAGGDITVGSECNAPAAAVRYEFNFQVWFAAVVDEASDLCRDRLESVICLVSKSGFDHRRRFLNR